MASEYLTAEDLEAMTGIAQSTWRYYSSVGKGPNSFRLGKRRLWKRSDVEEWLAEQRAAAR